MALPDEQLRACLAAIGRFIEKRRPPVEIRNQVDIHAEVNGGELVILELRPHFRDAGQKVERGIAKAKWVHSRKVWRLFWMRADLKWHSYQPLPEAPSIATLLEEVDKDPYGCFFG